MRYTLPLLLATLGVAPAAWAEPAEPDAHGTRPPVGTPVPIAQGRL